MKFQEYLKESTIKIVSTTVTITVSDIQADAYRQTKNALALEFDLRDYGNDYVVINVIADNAKMAEREVLKILKKTR